MNTGAVSVRHYKLGPVDVVEAEGEIDVLSVRDFGALLAEVSEKSDKLVADLRKVNYVDSAGLEALIKAYLNLSARDRQFGSVGVKARIIPFIYVFSFKALKV